VRSNLVPHNRLKRFCERIEHAIDNSHMCDSCPRGGRARQTFTRQEGGHVHGVQETVVAAIVSAGTHTRPPDN
jgi:hypothetical protein